MSKKDPYGHFADVMRSTMSQHTQQAISGLGAVLGTITASGVKLDDFKHEIQDYMIAELPGLLELPQRIYTGSVHPQGQGSFHGGVSLSDYAFDASAVQQSVLHVQHGLKPGDRVLALRVNSGNDVVIVCKVVNAGG
nr:hypothetical protein [Paenibacillus sp. SGZ-1009]